MLSTMTNNYFIRYARVISEVNANKLGITLSYTVFNVCFDINLLPVIGVDILSHQFGINTSLMPFTSCNFPTSLIFESTICLSRI